MKYSALLDYLKSFRKDQLQQEIVVSAGCDENGNATFYNVDRLIIAADPCIYAGTDVLEPDQFILLFDEEE